LRYEASFAVSSCKGRWRSETARGVASKLSAVSLHGVIVFAARDELMAIDQSLDQVASILTESVTAASGSLSNPQEAKGWQNSPPNGRGMVCRPILRIA